MSDLALLRSALPGTPDERLLLLAQEIRNGATDYRLNKITGCSYETAKAARMALDGERFGVRWGFFTRRAAQLSVWRLPYRKQQCRE